MDVHGAGRSRAGIVVRARFVEDLVEEQGADQLVLLGASLDTLAQRRPGLVERIFEIDQPDTQTWKRRRLAELGYEPPIMVPVDSRRTRGGTHSSQPGSTRAGPQ